jgi:hypothetical protein
MVPARLIWEKRMCNAMARAAVRRSGVCIHPRIAALKAKLALIDPPTKADIIQLPTPKAK